MRIAVCFFGITRALGTTIESITENILLPARRLGQVRVFAHIYPLAHVHNPRTQEEGELDANEYRLLGADELLLEEPGACLARWRYPEIAAFGDPTGDDFKSLRNLLHQLHSLREVSELALAWEPDIVVFCRPDLMYFDSFERTLTTFARRSTPCCGVPYWQSYGGLNDRFAVVRGPDLVRRYGHRVEKALAFCQAGPQPLQSELLLRWCLSDAPVRFVALRAARIRAGGRPHPYEPFALDRIRALHTRLHDSRLPPSAKRVGHKTLSLAQSMIDFTMYGSAEDPLRKWSPAP